jgi:mannose-6-phosphate isomerase-like protein (cupin superfamily)
MEKVNIRRELATINEHWSQKTIGTANGQLFKVAKGIGETNWHKHDDQDELFILYKGHLTIQLREKNMSYMKMKCLLCLAASNIAQKLKMKLNS